MKLFCLEQRAVACELKMPVSAATKWFFVLFKIENN